MMTKLFGSKLNFLFALVFQVFLLSLFQGCKKYDEGPSFSLLPVRVRLANEWKVADSANYVTYATYLKFTMFGKCKVSNDGRNWGDWGEWSFEEKREILEIDGRDYKILKLTNKELWIVDYFDGGITKFESTSFI